MYRVLDLFSGIGGFSLGLERTGGFKTVAFCEIDPFCREVLAKHWPGVPCHDDVREIRPPEADVITAGFPCTNISSAGKKDGIGGSESGLWRDAAKVIRQIRPRYAILENVAALLSRGMGDVLGDMASLGYSAFWECLPACSVGLPQRRQRVWIVAHYDSGGCQGLKKLHSIHTKVKRRLHADGLAVAEHRARTEAPSRIRGVDNGLPHRVDRVRSLGNAVVPQIPELIGRAILEAEKG